MSEKDRAKDQADKADSKIPWSEILKKVVNTGVGAAFMTEEAVRTALQDLPLPKETLNNLYQNARATKEEFVSTVKSELKHYLQGIDIEKQIDRVLEGYDIDLNAKISFKKKDRE